MIRIIQPLIFTVFILGLATNAELACKPETTLYDWPGFLLIGLAGILSLFLWGRKAWGEQLPSLTCVAALAAFAIWIAIRACLSPVDYLARGDLALLGVFVVVYSLTSAAFAEPTWRNWLVGLQLLFGFCNLGLAIYQVAFDSSFHPLPWIERDSVQASGLFDDTNHFAASLLFPACILGGILVGGSAKAGSRTFAALGLGLCLGGLVLAVSRSGYLAAGVGIFGLAMFAFWPQRVEARHRWTAPLGVSAVALTLLLAGVWVLGSAGDGVSTGIRAQIVDALKSSRIELWEPAWRQVEMEPVLGTGSRTYEIYNRQFRPESMPAEIEERTFANNDVLQLTAEYGWIGISLALVCIGIHLAFGVQAIGRELAERKAARVELASSSLGLTMGAICALLALLTLAFFEAHLHVPSIAVLAAISLAILANPTGPKQIKGRPAAAGLAQVAAIIAGTLLLWFGHRYTQSDWHEIESEKLARADRLEESLKELRSARVLDPSDPALHIREAELAVEIYGANLDAAANSYHEGYELYPQDPRLLISLGATLAELGREDEATRYFEEAVFWAPSYGVTRYAYASHLSRLGRDADANLALRWAGEATAYHWTSEILTNFPPTTSSVGVER